MEVIAANLNVCNNVLSYLSELFVQVFRHENVKTGPLFYWNKYSKEGMFLRLINCKMFEMLGNLFNLILSNLSSKKLVGVYFKHVQHDLLHCKLLTMHFDRDSLEQTVKFSLEV